jgi:uncharacterized MAPEG superfamily protein
MSLALWMVVVAGIMPVLTVGIAKGMGQRYNNREPRLWAQNLDGLPRRAHAAHQNHFEFFPLFGIATLLAEWKTGGGGTLNALAGLIILARIVYTGAYLADKDMLRSIAWMAGWFGTLAIFGLVAFKG